MDRINALSTEINKILKKLACRFCLPNISYIYTSCRLPTSFSANNWSQPAVLSTDPQFSLIEELTLTGSM